MTWDDNNRVCGHCGAQTVVLRTLDPRHPWTFVDAYTVGLGDTVFDDSVHTPHVCPPKQTFTMED